MVTLTDGTSLDFQGSATVAVLPPAILQSFDSTQTWELQLYWSPDRVNAPGSQTLSQQGLATLKFYRAGAETWTSTAGTVTFTQLSNDHAAVVAGTIDSAALVADDASKSQVAIPSASFRSTMP
jgi:hypothetical protein